MYYTQLATHVLQFSYTVSLACVRTGAASKTGRRAISMVITSNYRHEQLLNLNV